MPEKEKIELTTLIDKCSSIALNALFIIFIVILIIISISFVPNLDSTQKVFSILGSFSLGVAVLAYFYKKRQDETLAAIEQISFLRKEIIPQCKAVDDKIKNKNKAYNFCRIRPTEYSMKALVEDEDISLNFNTQLSAFYDRSDKDASKWITDGEILYEQATLLNMLEEFSLRVQHFKTLNHQALISVNGAFVEIIEKNLVALFFIRDITNASSVYDNVLLLYKSWKDLTEKPNILKNLKKHGILSKKQADELYDERRKRFTLV